MKISLVSMNLSKLIDIKYDILNYYLEEYMKSMDIQETLRIKDIIRRVDYSLDLDEEVRNSNK